MTALGVTFETPKEWLDNKGPFEIGLLALEVDDVFCEAQICYYKFVKAVDKMTFFMKLKDPVQLHAGLLDVSGAQFALVLYNEACSEVFHCPMGVLK